MKRTDYITLTPHRVMANGSPLTGGPHLETGGTAFLSDLYHRFVGDYPKFFKMDTLGKLGFLAAELLLKIRSESLNAGEVPAPREDRGVVLFGRHSSLRADTHFQASIQDRGNFFPSPSVFVYTLPNVTAGEISIRRKYTGESAYFVLEAFDARIMARQLLACLQDEVTQSLLTGWVDCRDDEHYEAAVMMLEKSAAWTEDELAEQLNTMFNQLNN